MTELDVQPRPGLTAPFTRLTIAEVETIPIRVPLERATAAAATRCRIGRRSSPGYTPRKGIVGEAYCGDEDKRLVEIEVIIQRRSLLASSGRTPLRDERLWELSRPRTSTSSATAGSGSSPACVDPAIWDAIRKAVDGPLLRLWGGYRDRRCR